MFGEDEVGDGPEGNRRTAQTSVGCDAQRGCQRDQARRGGTVGQEGLRSDRLADRQWNGVAPEQFEHREQVLWASRGPAPLLGRQQLQKPGLDDAMPQRQEIPAGLDRPHIGGRGMISKHRFKCVSKHIRHSFRP